MIKHIKIFIQKEWKYLIIIILITGILILIPFILRMTLFSSIIKGSITDSDWVSFLSSYIGIIIGFLGIILTIIFTANQNREDRRLQVAPCLSITFKPTKQLINTESLLDYILYSEENCDTNLYGILTLKNVGFGPLIDCILSDVNYNNCLFPRAFKINNTNALGTGEKWYITVGIGVTSGIIKKEHLWQDKEGESWPLPNTPILKDRILEFTLNYKDIINNSYKQTIKLNIIMTAQREHDGLWHIYPEMHLSTITPREITKKPIKNEIVPLVVAIDEKKRSNK